jgi:hypothetical protein
MILTDHDRATAYELTTVQRSAGSRLVHIARNPIESPMRRARSRRSSSAKATRPEWTVIGRNLPDVRVPFVAEGRFASACVCAQFSPCAPSIIPPAGDPEDSLKASDRGQHSPSWPHIAVIEPLSHHTANRFWFRIALSLFRPHSRCSPRPLRRAGGTPAHSRRRVTTKPTREQLAVAKRGRRGHQAYRFQARCLSGENLSIQRVDSALSKGRVNRSVMFRCRLPEAGRRIGSFSRALLAPRRSLDWLKQQPALSVR